MQRLFALIYGAVAYTIGMASLVYFAGWLGNFWVPRTIDSGPSGPLWATALLNSALFATFAVQHSLMARPSFKAWWTGVVPAPMERSTYSLCSGLAVFLLAGLWQPTGIMLWEAENSLLRMALIALYFLGWFKVTASTFLIHHFDLFGLRQVYLFAQGKPYESLGFVTPGPYRLVRHPIYVGWLTVAWATPTMSLDHLAFALAMTVYILIAIQLEERNLLQFYGETYAAYRRQTPMLIPGLNRILPRVGS
jgi:protein-S-isoprenylcysteine O-methyltransferase Ste14